MKNFLDKLKGSALRGFLIATFTMIFIAGFTAFAISFPSSTPSGEIAGGQFNKYFNQIFSDCGLGKALQGYNETKDPICVPLQAPETPITTIPTCNAPDITLSNGQVWSACNVGTNTAGIGSASYGSFVMYNNAKLICPSGRKLPSSNDWQLAYNNQGMSLPITLKLPKAGYIELDGFTYLDNGTDGHYRSSTPYNVNGAYQLYFNNSVISPTFNLSSQNYGLSVRCIKDTTTCTSFTYSAWGTCQSNNTQSRTVSTSTPSGCTGGTPITTQSCTYVAPVTTCTSFTYGLRGTCQSDNTQYRSYTGYPSGCTGGGPDWAQPCTYVAPVTTCTSFTYSAWGACQSNSTQSRTVSTSTPSGCTGGNPITTQGCVFEECIIMDSYSKCLDWLNKTRPGHYAGRRGPKSTLGWFPSLVACHGSGTSGRADITSLDHIINEQRFFSLGDSLCNY